MLGGIIGDVIGSVYEGYQWQQKDLPLISSVPVSEREGIKPMLDSMKWSRRKPRWTDDTLCTLALYYAYINKEDPTVSLVNFCKKFNDKSIGFGKSFKKWIDNPIPYESLGNGSIMRVGFIPYLNEPLSVKLKLAYDYTAISHNHQDSFDAVEYFVTICDALQQAKEMGLNHKQVLFEYLKENKIDDTVQSLHEEFKFDLNAKTTLNQAVCILVESNSLKEALVNSFYVGGDSDTIACVVGNMAGIVYELPEQLLSLSLKTLEPYPELINLVKHFLESRNI